jgi:hypothetical protein
MRHHDSLLRRGDDLSRRSFLEWFARMSCGVTLGGVALESAAAAAQPARVPRAKHVIALYLRGGLSHVDTFDPKPGRAEMGGVKPIATSADGVQVGDWFPRLASQMHHVALVRSMTSTQGVHERGTYLARTNYFQTPTITHASFGSWVYRRLGTENKLLPGFVLVNGNPMHPGSGYMESHLAPLPIVDPGEGLQNSALPRGVGPDDLARRIELARSLSRGFADHTPHRTAAAYQRIRDEAVGLMKSKDLQAFDITRESPATLAAYGTHTFGQGCLLARRLVEHGVRFIEVEDTNNFDTHNDHVPQMRTMTPPVDQTMAALLSDLHDRGLLDSTIVMMTTEFGRSPGLDPLTKGRGHHPAAFTWWLAGGGIKGGYVHGCSDEKGERVADKPVNMEDFNATVAHALGIDLAAKEFSPSGRPFMIAHDGKPVLELFA